MLKVEKDCHATLCFHTKERLFTKTFLKAFGIAFGLHLLGLTVFHISPIKMRESTWLFPPTLVETEKVPDLSNLTILASPDQEKIILRGIPLPVPSRPSYPKPIFPNQQAHVFKNLQESSSLTSDLFFQIEKKKAISSISLPAQPKPSVQFSISGALANQQILSNNSEGILKNLAQHSAIGFHVLKYSVQMDHKTGKIFWYAAEHSSLDPFLDTLAESFLLSLQFPSNPEGFVTNGTVELAFHD